MKNSPRVAIEPFTGNGPDAQAKDGCSVELYQALVHRRDRVSRAIFAAGCQFDAVMRLSVVVETIGNYPPLIHAPISAASWAQDFNLTSVVRRTYFA
jgi:hypothetical protein